jgi:hypothetical protein
MINRAAKRIGVTMYLVGIRRILENQSKLTLDLATEYQNHTMP